MYKNHFKIAIRNLWKHKTYTGINVFGLSLAFVCSILLFINAKNELSFDESFIDKDRIFKPYFFYHNVNSGDEYMSSMCFPMAPTLKAEVPFIEASTRVMGGGSEIEYNGKLYESSIDLVDDDFFKIFSVSVLNGVSKNPLSSLGDAVITEKVSSKIFKNENPIGKKIKLKVYGEWKDFVVNSVVKSQPTNASISYEVLVRSELSPDYNDNKNDWNNLSHEVYVKISKNGSKEIIEEACRHMLKKYNAVDTTYLKNSSYEKDGKGDYNSLRFLPMNDFHFNQEVGTGKVISKVYVYTLLLLSVFILVIACFNFINLNIARSFTRAKEVGIRKCLGADKKQIFIQIWGESLLLCTVSLLLGVFGAMALFPYFNQLFDAQLSLSFFYLPSTILIMLLSLLIVSLFAGGYPAVIISKLNTVGVLKGAVSIKKPGLFRNSLIVMQFGIACFLMACTLIAYNQFEFMRKMPLGFNKESVISIPISNVKNGRYILNQFRNRLISNPSIVSISGSNINIGIGKDGSRSKTTSGFDYNGKSISTNVMTVDYDFLKTLGIKINSGRDFGHAYPTDSTTSVIITESVAKQFGVKDAVGLSFSTDTTQPNFVIIGIIPDFHLYSLHEQIEPLTLNISNYNYIQYIFIKVNSNNSIATLNEVEKIYKELEPEKEFKASFINDNTNNWYKKESQLSLLLAISAIIATLLSCLGLFALALLMMQQRTKEIGVRKVLGGSVFNINKLLIKDFIGLVVVSIVIASPFAWFIMNKWLQDFPYKTEISLWLFIIIGLLAIFISILTVSFHTIRAATANPVKSLRTE